MRIGIMSDTHNRYATVAAALTVLEARKVELILHCGDIEDEATVRLFRSIPTHFVFGNCDTDTPSMRKAFKETKAKVHEPFGDLELDGHKIAWLHGDNKMLFKDVETSGYFEFLFYGHTHQAKEHRTGPTRVVNPGALHRARVKTLIVLELPSGEVESVEVAP